MEFFFKITKEEANLIGKFEYASNQQFDPFVGEQMDGNYIISEKMYELLKDREEFKKINWTEKQTIEKNSLNTKPVQI